MSDNPYLRLVSENEIITIPACKGGEKANIYNAKKTFPGYIDSDFKEYGCDTPQPRTEKTDVEVYEMYNKDAAFRTLFGSLCPDLVSKYGYDNLSFVNINELKSSLKKNKIIFESQEQIEIFCKKNKQWLRRDAFASTFFLFTEEVNGEEKFFVASVYLGSAELGARVNHLSRDSVWNASSAHRVVTKTLDTQS